SEIAPAATEVEHATLRVELGDLVPQCFDQERAAAIDLVPAKNARLADEGEVAKLQALQLGIAVLSCGRVVLPANFRLVAQAALLVEADGAKHTFRVFEFRFQAVVLATEKAQATLPPEHPRRLADAVTNH